ncbi:MAG: DUF1573 domain-containing protein [Bacteroidia bacterium]|nr:DUF1573 domain-containing protein [Bacteroidia bacterium]
MNFAAILGVAVLVAGLSACQTDKTQAPAASAATTTTTPAPAAPASPDGAAPAAPEWQAKAESMAATKIEWASDKYNFGSVPAGTTVTHKFKFKNTGTEPLVITRVKASCGCTTPNYSKDPIAPGEDGFIDVSFDSTGKNGMQTKTITVTGNFPEINKILQISGEVMKADVQ